MESSVPMQKAALDYVSLFMGEKSQPVIEDLKLFIHNANQMTSDRMREWWKLLLVLNPLLTPYAHSQKTIKQTIQWLIYNADQFHSRGDT
ncbi:hypothetical protein [Paenibacillus sp. L3-i20]|uniref:hypothetical protein n=1 Tax=Paenibacillus sp. L3-i20 TaxID=2905833 RepID=UPI0020826B8B|nr:hypothetical protein [Paenibacillus sp. L3-i20]GKU77824.1 hypothetical protein L3i20_v222210 [Paenibacillus sp. L3-i20]